MFAKITWSIGWDIAFVFGWLWLRFSAQRSVNLTEYFVVLPVVPGKNTR